MRKNNSAGRRGSFRVRLALVLLAGILGACSQPSTVEPTATLPLETLILPSRTPTAFATLPDPESSPTPSAPTATPIPTNTEPATQASATPSPAATLGPAPEIEDAFGVAMVLVPAGEFIMGYEGGERDEAPIHRAYLDSFYIDKYEVTNQQYAAFLNERGNQIEFSAFWVEFNDPDIRIHETEGVWTADPGWEQHPLIEMTWFGARAYCEWRGARLPSEAEWEKAARGPDGQIFPWGDESPTCEMANFAGCNHQTVPVGSYPANVSPYGAFDMAGNVWEWVNDWWDPEYYTYSNYENPIGPENGDFKVRRGGAYEESPAHLRSTYRYHNYPPLTYRTIGFRCAASP